MATRFRHALRPLRDTCVPPHRPHWSYRLIGGRSPNALYSWHLSCRARLSHTSVIDNPLLTLVNTSNPPNPRQSDNNPPSSEVNAQNFRTLILCFDGTGNQFCESVSRSAQLPPSQHRPIVDPVDILQNTNVVKLFSILRKDIPKSQVCYYQESTHPTTFCHSLNATKRLTLGWYRDLH
jgi:hypothetical protein